MEKKMVMPSQMAQKIYNAGVVAVLVVDHIKHVRPLVQALVKGGVDTLELTLRTPVAVDAARIVKKEMPEVNLGFGTVLTIDQVKEVADVGADFAVSPGCNPKIIAEAYKQNLPFSPGVMTPTDIEIAVEQGCRILKFFPAETSGGVKHLKSMSAPYNHLDLRFIPLGGVNLSNAATYLENPLISAIGGSWIANRNLILNENWDKITNNAREIKDLIRKLRS